MTLAKAKTQGGRRKASSALAGRVTQSRVRHKTVNWRVRDGVAWVTLTRRDEGNRIDEATAQVLCDAVAEIEFDERVALVVLSGEGSTFCVGSEQRGDWEFYHDWVAAVAGLTRPVLGVVNGDAIAEGCELALACDLRVASASARFSLPQVSEGRLPVHGGTQRLPRIIGRMRALEMLLSGRAVHAREALRIGLVNRIAPPRRLAALVKEEVGALNEKGPVALRLAKDAVIKGLDLTLDQGIRLEQDLYVLLQTTADREEGIRAFLEKRQPHFEGR